MKNKYLLIALTILFSINQLKAQNNTTDRTGRSGLALELGASVNYYYGLPDRNFGKFENDRVNWQLNGMLGITLTRDKADRRTMIAAFGGLGFNNRSTISQIINDQEYVSTALNQASVNNFYQLEGGLVIADLLRVSTGIGQQNFDNQTLASTDGILLNTTHLKYNSSTVGIKLNFRSVAWTINCNFAYGKDFNKTVITPNTGLMLRF